MRDEDAAEVCTPAGMSDLLGAHRSSVIGADPSSGSSPPPLISSICWTLCLSFPTQKGNSFSECSLSPQCLKGHQVSQQSAHRWYSAVGFGLQRPPSVGDMGQVMSQPWRGHSIQHCGNMRVGGLQRSHRVIKAGKDH